MGRKKAIQPLTTQLRAIRVTPKLAAQIQGVRRLLSEEAGCDVSTAETMRRLMLRGLVAEPKPPALSPAVEEAGL